MQIGEAKPVIIFIECRTANCEPPNHERKHIIFFIETRIQNRERRNANPEPKIANPEPWNEVLGSGAWVSGCQVKSRLYSGFIYKRQLDNNRQHDKMNLVGTPTTIKTIRCAHMTRA